jgi:hypothetical protein
MESSEERSAGGHHPGAAPVDNYLTFAHENAGFVLDGLEDATVRHDLDRVIEVGDVLELRTPGGTVFAYADVEDVWLAPVRLAQPDMVFVDDRNHPSSSPIDLLDRLEGHYPDADLNLSSEVTIIYFSAWHPWGDSSGE